MQKYILGITLAFMLVSATPVSAEVGGTITRQASPATTSAINSIVNIVLEFFTWESNIGTVTFEDGRFSATAGCNGLGSSYEINGTAIDFGDIISTQMYCDGKMENEMALSKTFAEATTMTFKNGSLILIDVAGIETAFKATFGMPTK